jgi:hypothetical protein
MPASIRHAAIFRPSKNTATCTDNFNVKSKFSQGIKRNNYVLQQFTALNHSP